MATAALPGRVPPATGRPRTRPARKPVARSTPRRDRRGPDRPGPVHPSCPRPRIAFQRQHFPQQAARYRPLTRWAGFTRDIPGTLTAYGTPWHEPALIGAGSRPWGGGRERPCCWQNTMGVRMRVLVLGGDGFCGWPTTLYLSDRGHDITIIDNLSRRKIDVELEVDSLTPIRPTGERIRVWREVSGREVGFINLDLATEYDRLVAVLEDIRPDAIVHFAEQRAAPYSMRNTRAKRYTVDNNVRATHNLLTALVATGSDASLVHLGTMGVYGYGWSGTAPIPEGYLTVKVPTPDGELEREILHPANPGSVYHLTKTLDQLLFSFYAKNDGLAITDLHQGIVWGTQTPQTIRDERLVNRFDYDGDYGTVLNRFLMQAAIGHPLTVHGSGGQTRAFIHIRDTVRCVEIAVTNPPEDP